MEVRGVERSCAWSCARRRLAEQLVRAVPAAPVHAAGPSGGAARATRRPAAPRTRPAWPVCRASRARGVRQPPAGQRRRRARVACKRGSDGDRAGRQRGGAAWRRWHAVPRWRQPGGVDVQRVSACAASSSQERKGKWGKARAAAVAAGVRKNVLPASQPASLRKILQSLLNWHRHWPASHTFPLPVSLWSQRRFQGRTTVHVKWVYDSIGRGACQHPSDYAFSEACPVPPALRGGGASQAGS